MVLLAAWCAMRFGELAELRRADVDVTNEVVHVRRGVVRDQRRPHREGPEVRGGQAGRGDPAAPDAGGQSATCATMWRPGRALMFPAASGGHMAPSSLYAVYHPARETPGGRI